MSRDKFDQLTNVLRQEGFKVIMPPAGTEGYIAIFGGAHGVGTIFPYMYPQKDAVRVDYMRFAENGYTLEQLRQAMRLKSVLDKIGIPYLEVPSKEKFEAVERRRIADLEAEIAEARESIKIVCGGER